ncbi:FkbM family methyltransferase [Labrys neptuniae]|uniref:FkbM family methyltransferase n=1 Tax=Labrys neptuniae TaxID=376174 RepID=A0ABV3PJQ1_9HYPH
MDPQNFHHHQCSLWRFEIFDTLSKHVAQKGKKVKFIHVGANVGNSSDDPVFGYVVNHGWQGALVEPVPYLFEKLKKNYEPYSDLSFFQLCCSTQQGTLPFYMLEEASASDSPLGPFLSSFEKEVILKHSGFFTDLASHIREIQVETVRVDTIIERANLQGFNALVVDTEGHDDKVVAGLNLDAHAPELIMVEYHHLQLEMLRHMHERLLDYGYRPIWMYYEIIYVRHTDLNYPLVKKITTLSETMYRL